MGAGPSRIHRPTENAAVRTKELPLPPVSVLLDLHLTATATRDRYGARLFLCQLDRVLGGVR
jgi:hypothetical protein